jgi:hypothetical protein
MMPLRKAASPRGGRPPKAATRREGAMQASHSKEFASFEAFYPFYLQEHQNATSRRLHWVGTSLAMVCLLMALLTLRWEWLVAVALCGYGFAWVGHLAFERNRPATFRHPVYSLMGDVRLWWETLRGRSPW